MTNMQNETTELAKTAFSTDFIEVALRDIDRDPTDVVLSREGDGALVLRVSQVEMGQASDAVMSQRYSRPYVTVEGEGQVALLDFVDRLGQAVRWAKINTHTGMADVAVFPGFRPIEAKPQVVVFYEDAEVEYGYDEDEDDADGGRYDDRPVATQTETPSQTDTGPSAEEQPWPRPEDENTYNDSEADTAAPPVPDQEDSYTDGELRALARLYGYQAAAGALATLFGLMVADLINEIEH